MSDVFNEIINKRKKMKSDWNRILPTNELLFDRWEKAKYIGAGENTSIYDSCVIIGEVKIGHNTWVGPYTLLDGSGDGLTIGNNCSISSGVQIYTHDTVLKTLSGGKMPAIFQKVIIGNNCYIGPLSIISKGVKIGDACVIGANSFVNKSFDKNSIIAGTPAIKIGEVCYKENGDICLKYYDKRG